MGWGQRHRPNPTAEAARLASGHERRYRITLAAERFAAAEAELVAADRAWPDAMVRTALLDVDQVDIERIQERNRLAVAEHRAAKTELLKQVRS